MKSKYLPWTWIPSLYMAEGIPYVIVMTVATVMYERMGLSNSQIALYTSWLYLPWVIKPFWSPFVDLLKTKRWWVVSMQFILAAAFAGIAFTIPSSFFFQLTLAVFWLMAFTSATHDIAADGFYMHALTTHGQSLYVGIRSTFYRIATIAGQGLLVILAGLIEMNSGLAPARLRVDASPQQVCVQQPALEEKTGEAHFLYTPVLKEVRTAEGVSSLIGQIRQMNARNGFIKAEAKAASTPIKKEESAFTRFIRLTFGEDRALGSGPAPRAFMVGVRLSEPPQEGKSQILNVQFKSGNQGIQLEQSLLSSRLEFTSANWNRPAYLLFHVDTKIKDHASAVFEGTSGNVPLAWMAVFLTLSVLFLLTAFYHHCVLPRPTTDHAPHNATAGNLLREFFETFKTFFTKPQAATAILFMLLYRLPEAQMVKLINPFLLDPIDHGGLGLTTGEVGLVYGTIGILGLTIGGIVGGIAAAHGGLKRWLWPMALSMSLTCATFVYLSYGSGHSLFTINLCVFIEQFGYGFGFTAYMLYLIYFSEGEHQTSHYAMCTGFMALGMMLPGMAAGWLQETIGYRHFFVWTMICCLATVAVCAFIKIDPKFGKKQ